MIVDSFRILDSGTTVAPPEKLMRPRPTRPPAYSLDGFVPKPSTSNLELTAVHPPVSLSGASTSNSASSTSTSALTINGKKVGKLSSDSSRVPFKCMKLDFIYY